MPTNTKSTNDKQIVEVLGRNRLIEILLTEGVEVAIPVRDKRIDLVAYFWADPLRSRFVAAPIQMKAASKKSFVLDKKYAETPGLLLAYVSHVNDGEETEIFLLTYHEALKVLEQRGHAKTDTWQHKGEWSATNPTGELLDALTPFKVGRGEFRQRLEKSIGRARRNSIAASRSHHKSRS